MLTSEFVQLEKLYINPDSQKQTKAWRELLLAVGVAERKGNCEVITTLTTTHPGSVKIGNVCLSIEAPSAAFILAGSGSTDDHGRTISSNSVSAVLKIGVAGNATLLLTGDLDEVGLENALANGRSLSCETLVFPHHGGLPNSNDPGAFATKLLEAVSPSYVVISHGREKHKNPRPEVVTEILSKGCGVACTQLSKHCHSAKILRHDHAESIRAHGRKSGAVCGGSMTIRLDGVTGRDASFMESHQHYITEYVSTPLCRP